MKIFITILTIIAVILIGYNLTIVDYNTPLTGESGTAIITIVAALCAILLLQILRISKKIEQTVKQK